MQILRDYKDCPEALKGAALAIGNFDGVHRGHQVVLRAAISAAAGTGAPSGVMTFEPHPRAFFQPDKPLFRLSPEPVKCHLLEALGLDVTVVLPFAAPLASLSAEEFVTEILIAGLGVSHVVTGSDFHFGKGREGGPDAMRAFGEKYGFGVTLVEPQGSGEDVYSSTAARDCLRAGDPRGASDILGYWWRVGGEVTGGDKRGAGLGFPTANIMLPASCQLKHGIYAVRVWADGARHHGAAYLGTRPSFDDGDPVLETFLLDFSGDLYGKEIEIEFIAFLRGDEKFESVESLQQQMKADCQKAELILVELEAHDPMAALPLGPALG